jgi:hypothetical protein
MEALVVEAAMVIEKLHLKHQLVSIHLFYYF